MSTVLSRRQALALGGIVVASSAVGGPALAQAYPDKPIRLIVPAGPGGPSDMMARLMTQVIPAALGQPLVVENRPGAGGGIGARFVAASEPDGYTLLLANNAALCVVPALLRNPGFDPVKSFTPVAQLTESTLVFTVPNRVPANTVGEFIAYAKARSGKLSYASAGVGNVTQLMAEIFKAKAGVDLVHVPYKSGAEMVTAILSDQVELAFPDVSILLPLVREKRLKVLAVTAGRRHPDLPGVPTMVEAGIPDFVMPFWSGIVAPAGTPEPIVSRLNAAIRAGLATGDVKAALAKVGTTPRPGSVDEFRRFVEAESRKWADIVHIAGLQPQ